MYNPKVKNLLYIYEAEPYVYTIEHTYIYILAQFRPGILPIKIETGRFTHISLELRLCILSEENSIDRGWETLSFWM